jgi:hypothetical protein
MKNIHSVTKGLGQKLALHFIGKKTKWKLQSVSDFGAYITWNDFLPVRIWPIGSITDITKEFLMWMVKVTYGMFPKAKSHQFYDLIKRVLFYFLRIKL